MKKEKEIKNLRKHLTRAASSSENRPILQCVHYSKDGSITVTDSHRLLKIYDFHEHTEDFNQNLKTMKLSEENFPCIDHLLVDEFKTEVVISLSVLLRIMKALITKAGERVTFEIKENEIIFKNSTDVMFYGEPVVISTKARVTGPTMTISFQGGYIKDCCEFFLDALPRYEVDDVRIKLNSPIRPVTFSIDETKHKYLVTPIRL